MANLATPDFGTESRSGFGNGARISESQHACVRLRKWKRRQRRFGRGQVRGGEGMGRNRVAVGELSDDDAW